MDDRPGISVVPNVKHAQHPPAAGPGRPAGGDRDTRSLILDVAEQVFAERGYVAAGTREIAQRAGVRQSMISYYFESKQQLFEATFKRRGTQLTNERLRNLDALFAEGRPAPAVADVVRAYLLPQFQLKRSGPGGMAFVRLQARIHNEPEALSFKLRREVYDQSTKRYIAALERLLPGVDVADISWRMMFAIGAYLYMLSDVARLDDLSDGRFSTDDLDELVARLTQFLSAGFSAAGTYDETPKPPLV